MVQKISFLIKRISLVEAENEHEHEKNYLLLLSAVNKVFNLNANESGENLMTRENVLRILKRFQEV